jgi:hypothetical protein
MNSFGLYTLGNDGVYDQIVALVNSIERNVDATLPICIIPFDHHLTKIRQFVESRSQVSLFTDQASIDRWDGFAREAWAAHDQSQSKRLRHPKWYKTPQLMRKFCAFDGAFEQFVFYDADSLAMSSLDRLRTQLQTYDFVFDDWEHQKPSAAASFDLARMQRAFDLEESELRSQIHCSSFFGSSRRCFNPSVMAQLYEQLVEQREVNWISDHAFWCDADLFSYMTFRSRQAIYNFTRSPYSQDRTGNIAEMDYVNVDQVLFNAEGMKPIHRLHYNTHSATKFTRLCQGEAVDLPYQDVFLFYRFLHEPEQRPQSFQSPPWMTLKVRSMNDKWRKIQQLVA